MSVPMSDTSPPMDPWTVAHNVEVEIGDKVNPPGQTKMMVGLRLTPIVSGDRPARSLGLDAEGGMRWVLDPVQAEILCNQLRGALDLLEE